MDKSKRSRLLIWLGLALGAGVFGGLAAVYVISSGAGNAGACDDALKTASKLDDLRKGDVAGFQPAREPVDLSGLKFNAGTGPTSLGEMKGRTLLVNFWATWCVPCRAEMPALDALEGARGGKDFGVIPVNLDVGGADKPKAFYAETGISHLAHYGDSTMSVFNAIKSAGLAIGLPTTLLVDGRGCLIGSLAGPAEWNGTAARALIEKAVSLAGSAKTG